MGQRCSTHSPLPSGVGSRSWDPGSHSGSLPPSPSWGLVPTFSGNVTHKSLHSAYFLPLLCSKPIRKRLVVPLTRSQILSSKPLGRESYIFMSLGIKHNSGLDYLFEERKKCFYFFKKCYPHSSPQGLDIVF